MWLRIPVELLAFNQGSGAGAGDGNGTGAGGSSGSSGAGTGGSDGKSGEGSGDGTGGGSSGDGSKPTVDVNSQEFKDAVKAATEGQIEDRLKRDRQRRESDVERQKTEAAAQALKDNQKFEELAKTRETQLVAANGQIETLTTERDALTVRVTEADAAIAKILTSQTKDLPPYLVPLLSKMTPAEQLTYLADNAEQIRKGSTQAIPNHGSGSGTGTGSGTGGSGTSGDGKNLALSYIGSTYGRQDKKDK
jgi:hypothetical protein